MTPAETLAAAHVPGTHSVFFLGCFDKRVTLYSQQVRALNLVAAILDQEAVRSDGRVAIVGGGAAGVTAAVAFAKAAPGLKAIDVYEAESQVMHLQRTSGRYLHPHNYDWPAATASSPVAGLPILNWTAGPARDVQAHIAGQFEAVRRASPIEVFAGRRVERVTPFKYSQARVEADGHGGTAKDYDAVILAIGFGLERSVGTDTPSYWSSTGLEEAIITHGPVEIFVSGNGDGGLVDFMTAAFDGLTHPQICQLLAEQDLGPARAQLEAVEHKAWDDPELDIFEAYKADVIPVTPPAVFAAIRDRLRDNARVMLHTNGRQLFKRETAILNRLGCALALATDEQSHRNRLSTVVGVEFEGPPPMTGPIRLAGLAPITPWKRFLRLGPDGVRNLKPFKDLVDLMPDAAKRRAPGYRPATPTLIDAATAKFGHLESPAAPMAAAPPSDPGDATPSGSFAVDPTLETMPSGLRAREPALFREKELAALGELCAAQAAGGVVRVIGPPRSGKTTLIREFATSLVVAPAPLGGLALLHIDVSHRVRPLRAAMVALGGRAGAHVATDAELDADGEDDDEPLEEEALFVTARLRARLGNRRLITVFEGYSAIARGGEYERELRDLAQSSAFKDAFQILETNGEPFETQLANVPITLEPFTYDQAIEFLVIKGQPRPIAEDAAKLRYADARELFHAGPLDQGAKRYSPALAALDRKTPDAFDLADAIQAHAGKIAREVIEKFCDAEARDRAETLVSMMAMSVFGGTPIIDALLREAGFAAAPPDGLSRLGWFERRLDGRLRLTGFALAAVQAAAKAVLAGETGGEERERLRSAILRLADLLVGDPEVAGLPPLDLARGWLESNAAHDIDLLGRITALNVLESYADPVMPLTEVEQRAAAPVLLSQGKADSLDQALGALVLYSRVPYGGDEAEVNDRRGFLESAETVLAQIAAGCAVSMRQLVWLDAALFFGSRRRRADEEVLQIRLRLSELLAAQETAAAAAGQGGWTLAWLSQLLNLANGLAGRGQTADARGLAEQARRLIDAASWWRSAAWNERILARLELLNERLSRSAAEGLEALRRAVAAAGRAVACAPENPGAVRFYVRCVRRLVRAEPDDGERASHVDSARVQLEQLLGDAEGWPVTVRAQFAAVMREEARRAWSLTYQQQRAKDAVALLRTSGASGALELATDPRASLVYARLLAFLGESELALASCEHSLALSPTPAAWTLKFRLLDEAGKEDWSGRTQAEQASMTAVLPKRLQAAIKEFQQWLRTHHLWTVGYRQVVLWTLQRRWRAQGSIERYARRRIEMEGGDYVRTSKARKLELFAEVYNRREQQLRNLARPEDFIDLNLATFDNQAQYERSKSVVSGGRPASPGVLKVLGSGLKRSPNNPRLLLRRAEYFRYIWDTDQAVAGFRRVMETAASGDIRREAGVGLIRTLHTAAIYQDTELSNANLVALRQESQLLEDLHDAGDHGGGFAILRDHIALELGDPIDWSSLDQVYKRTVGGLQGFPTTLISEFDEHRPERAAKIASIAEALEERSADAEVLGLAGMLYLRRAEKAVGNDREADFEKAIAFFRAAAIMERSWEGAERPLTSFRIARAILSAAEAFVSLNPIPELSTEGNSDQLALAEAKLRGAQSSTTGEFRRVIKRAHEESQRLRAQLVGLSAGANVTA